MQLSVDLRQRIIEFLADVPIFWEIQGRRAIIANALLDKQLEGQIEFAGSVREFVQRIVSLCVSYGTLYDGRDAFIAILESVKTYVGPDKQEQCDSFIERLHTSSTSGVDIDSSLPLNERIVIFLTSLPNIHAASTQELLVYSAGLDPELQNQISFGAPPAQFIRTLVPLLAKYKTLHDGRDTLVAIIDAARQHVGADKQAYCELLISELQKPSTRNTISTSETKAWTASDIDILQDIEAELGISLHECDNTEIEYRYNSFVLNSAEHVVGLNLSDGSLSVLPLSIKSLPHIEKMFLGNNQFQEFPSELLTLKNLTILDLGKNHIKELPTELFSLARLESLRLDANEIDTFPMSKEMLEQLNLLDLTHNRITKLPNDIGNITLRIKWRIDNEQTGLYLEGNPIESPPIELIKNGNESIDTYFRSLEQESKLLREIKVLFVGDGGAGKTSLVKRICEGRFETHEEPTEGIDIRRWTFTRNDESLEIKFWDFGGQELLHATHQFFLSKRGVYILVLDGRKDEKAHYWLKHIEAFGGDSPILVVLNKIDTNHRFDVNRQSLQEKFESIKGFYRISCADGTGIEDFLEGLWHTANNTETCNMPLPQDWSYIKAELEKSTENFISHEMYTQLCEQENVTEQEGQETLIELLHDLGVVLHFEDPELFSTYVLNPEWATKAVYKIINSRQVAEAHGNLNFSLLLDLPSSVKP